VKVISAGGMSPSSLDGALSLVLTLANIIFGKYLNFKI
jgi:hypothetical protein